MDQGILMKTLFKALVLAAGMTALLPSFANDEVARQRAEVDRKIVAAANSGDHRGALKLISEALASDERQYGKDHPALLQRLYLQWQLCKETRTDTNQIDNVITRIRSINEATLAGKDPEQLYLAGRFLMEIRQTQEAEPFFEKLVTVADASDDADPAWLYRGLDQLAEIRSLMPAGYDKARGTLERLIALREKHQGKTHHDLIRPLRMLAKVRRFEGEPYYQRVLDIERAHHVEDHPSVLRARLELARFYADHGKNGQALPSLDGFMASIRRIDPRKGNSPDLLPALFLKSRVLAGNDNYAEAARHLQRAYEILSSQPGVTNENRVALLQSQLVRFELTSTGSLSWLNDEHLAQLAEATYQQQVASKSLPPELGLVLKLELVDRALKRNPLNTWSDGIDHQARKDSITRAAREALKVSERHWPANDPVRQQLSQLLAKLQ